MALRRCRPQKPALVPFPFTQCSYLPVARNWAAGMLALTHRDSPQKARLMMRSINFWRRALRGEEPQAEGSK